VSEFLRRLFLHDVARKLLALLFAVVLFDVLDAKVQGSDRLTVHVVYVDAKDLAQLPESAERTSKLVVVERGDPEVPLVVANRPKPERLTLLLRGPKDALERAKNRRHTFVLELGKEGTLVPSAETLDGVAALRDALGAGATIEVDPPLELRVETEVRRAMVVGADDFALVGSPPVGFDRGMRTMVIRPPEVTLVGPRGAVDAAWERRPELFERVMLDGSSRQVTQSVRLAFQWRDKVSLRGAGGEELDGIRVTIEFKRRMVPVPGPEGFFDLPVVVECNDDLLRQRDTQRSGRDGWRLRFPSAKGPELRLKLQFSGPESAVVERLDRMKLSLAREQVALVVRAHELAGAERGTLQVAIVKFADFPEDLDVAFAPGESSLVEAEWEAPARDTAGDKGKEGDGDGGG